MRLTRRVFLESAGSVAAALALAACGGSADDGAADADTDGEAAVEQEGVATEEQAASEEPFPTIEEAVLYDAEGIKVVAKSLEECEDEAVLTLSLENSRDNRITIGNGYSTAINGIMMENNNMGFSCEVEPNSTAEAEATVPIRNGIGSLEGLGIGAITDIRFFVEAKDDNSNTIANELVAIETSAAGEYVQEYDESGEVVYDDNGLTIIYQGGSEREEEGDDGTCLRYQMQYEFINSSDTFLYFRVNGSVSDIGEGSYSHFAASLTPGCRGSDSDAFSMAPGASCDGVTYTGEAQDLLTDETLFTLEFGPVVP